MIKAEKLSFSYGKKQVLQDVSLELERGRLYTVIGPNGSGKTTLLHALAKLNKPCGGLTLDGEDYAKIARRDFAKKLTLLPQERSIPDMTVFDLVSAGRYPHLDFSRRLGGKDIKVIQNAMTATGVEEFSGRSLRKLSGGERQRSYIAMLMAQETPYLLLDEPTAHLDISHAFEVMELLRGMRDEGKCVITVLHDLPMALDYADKVIVLQSGEVKAVGAPEKIQNSGCIESVFQVRYTGKGPFEYLAKN